MSQHARKPITLGALACMFVVHMGKPSECGRTAYDCALFYVQRADYQSAVRLLKQELEAPPSNLKALNLLGIALTASGKVGEADAQFRKALSQDAGFYPARKNLAVNLFNSNRLEEAKAEFEEVLKVAPQDEVAHLFLGEIDFQTNQCARALPHYEKSRDRVVKDSALILHFSECLLEQGNQSKASATLDLLPANDADSQFRAGVVLSRHEDYTEAARFFAKAHYGYSDPYTAGYDETLMLVRGRNYAAAVQIAQELIREGHRHAELYNLMSEAYLGEGRLAEAYEALRTATQIEPDAVDNYVDLVNLCLDYSNYDTGLEIANIGLRHAPNSDRLYIQRGVLYALKGKISDAQTDFMKASEIAPQKGLPYVAMGIGWMELGQPVKAVEMLRQKSKLLPGDAMVLYIYGMALMRSGAGPGSEGETEALRAFEKSVRLNPNFSHSRAELGKLLLRRGEVDRAIRNLTKSAEDDPSDPAPAFQLAQAYRKKGQEARAQEWLAKVSKIHDEERAGHMGLDLKRILREGNSPYSQNQTKP